MIHTLELISITEAGGHRYHCHECDRVVIIKSKLYKKKVLIIGDKTVTHRYTAPGIQMTSATEEQHE